MSFPNIFSKQKKGPPAAKKPEKIFPKKEQVSSQTKISFGGVSSKILVSPHVTEKAALLAEQNQYIFKVHPHATKPAVKQAIQEAFGVNVVGVNVVTIRAKEKRVGRTLGMKSGYRKAIVTVQKGQKIEVLPR